MRQCLLQRENHYVVGLEEAEVAQDAKPHQQVADAEQQRTSIPLVGCEVLSLNLFFDSRSEDEQNVIEADHDVPAVDELPLAGSTQFLTEAFDKELFSLNA